MSIDIICQFINTRVISNYTDNNTVSVYKLYVFGCDLFLYLLISVGCNHYVMCWRKKGNASQGRFRWERLLCCRVHHFNPFHILFELDLQEVLPPREKLHLHKV